jgi:nicotinamidase-related amidase
MAQTSPTTIPALLIIDMQKGMARPAAGARNNPQAEENIARLLAAWRAAGATVIHVRHMSRTPGSPFWPGQDGAEFQPALAPLPAEHVMEKNVPDAFAASGLERWLRVRGIAALVITGVSTNNSVEATARSAGNLGFTTRVVADACFCFAQTDYAGVARRADEVHAMSLANLRGEYAEILDTAAALRLAGAAPAVAAGGKADEIPVKGRPTVMAQAGISTIGDDKM